MHSTGLRAIIKYIDKKKKEQSYAIFKQYKKKRRNWPRMLNGVLCLWAALKRVGRQVVYMLSRRPILHLDEAALSDRPQLALLKNLRLEVLNLLIRLENRKLILKVSFFW